MDIEYKDSKRLIKDADVLLFRAGKFPSVGWWIGKYTHSTYSHAALATWSNGIKCLEFREFKGSRIYPLDKYIEEGAQIDVFRPVDHIVTPRIVYDNNEYYVTYEDNRFDADVALNIINEAKKLLGRPYSYLTIWHILKTYTPFLRLNNKVRKNGSPKHKRFVCSTLVTYTYRKHFIDPVPFLSDEYTTPGDLARSTLFSYLFSIKNG